MSATIVLSVSGRDVQVVVRPEDVRRDRAREVVAELVLVCAARKRGQLHYWGASRHGKYALVLHVDQPLRVGIPEVALVREAEVDLGLIERVGDFVREDACREAGYDLLDPGFVCRVEDVVVDDDVIAEERELRRVAGGQDGCARTCVLGDRSAPCTSCS